MKKLWIVGKVNPANHLEWEFQGVFEEEFHAIAACLNEFYFVGPAELNMTVAIQTTEWPGAWYPRGP